MTIASSIAKQLRYKVEATLLKSPGATVSHLL
jgi:hypothetical protein